jgi:hypothetical protein
MFSMAVKYKGALRDWWEKSSLESIASVWADGEESVWDGSEMREKGMKSRNTLEGEPSGPHNGFVPGDHACGGASRTRVLLVRAIGHVTDMNTSGMGNAN